MTSTLYDRVVALTEDYLGPAADRFVARQIAFHLNKKPQELQPEDLAKLGEWIKLSLALLTEDKSMVKTFNEQLQHLTKP